MNDISKSGIGGLRVTRNETITDLAVKLIGRVTTSLNSMTASENSDFPDDIVLTGTPDDMIFRGENQLEEVLTIIITCLGVYSPILAATYSYLIEPSGIILDLSFILADIMVETCENMQMSAA